MILLARHGETDFNAEGRVQGWLDIPLNARGREQADALARSVARQGLATVYTSHLARARATAEAVGATVGLEPVVDERLAESHRGTWEGRLLAEIAHDDPELWAAWHRAGEAFRFPGGGESLGEHRDRVVAALEDVARGPLPALVVTHGGSIRMAMAARDPRGLGAFHAVEVPNAALIPLPGSEAAVEGSRA